MTRVEPLDAMFGAVVQNIVLARAGDATIADLTELWLEYALLVFPGQHMTQQEQDDFARRFGDLEFTASPLTTSNAMGRSARLSTTSPSPCAATSGGTTTAPTCPSRRWARCSRRRSSRTMAATPASPTCAPGTTRSTTPPESGSTASPLITPVATAWIVPPCT